MATVKRTGVHKVHDSGSKPWWPNVGDSVDAEWYSYFLEVLPPAFMSGSLLQIGEPEDHDGPEGAARYSTLQRDAGVWIYTGYQTQGTRVTVE